MLTYSPCNLCPRQCGADRTVQTGYCQCDASIKIARAALHFGEEPCISGKRGSGTVFFSGCTLRCCYCQNVKISAGNYGKVITTDRLSDIFLELQDKGAHNINLVTPTQYVLQIMEALNRAKPKLAIPVIYNTSGYERSETIRALRGYVDIYLPDLKYCSSDLSLKYSKADNYFEITSSAIKEMIMQTGRPVFGRDGMLQSGVLLRHLVLPGCMKDSIQLMQWAAKNLPKDKYLMSLMSQFTPNGEETVYKELNRRITTFEYNTVLREAIRLPIAKGFMQQRSSAKAEFTPPFDLEGV